MERFDVAIVGLGPCGATLANTLGQLGIRTLAIDSAAEILDYPRAVGMDDEALRAFQTLGLANPLMAEMISNTALRYFTAGGRCFAKVQPQEQPYGWPRRNLFIQPVAEGTIRQGIERFAEVTVRLGETLNSLRDLGSDGIEFDGERSGGSRWSARCRYLVGTDGGRSTVRDLVGVKLDGDTDAARWLVIDVRNDAIDLPNSCVFTDRLHPRMTIELPKGQRRFEFRLSEAETDEEAVAQENVERRLQQFFGDDALRSEVIRARVYRHHSRIADRFRVGNVFLAGDAAHLQPPFFGQGMNSGLRDVTNLGWKLALAVRGDAGDALLDTYETERRGHARKMVGMATMIGRLYSPKTRFGEVARDSFFQLAQWLPAMRDYVTQMKFKPMPFYESGFVAIPGSKSKRGPVGRMFAQPEVRTSDGHTVLFDDSIGPGFAIVGLWRDPLEALQDASLEFWNGLNTNYVEVRRVGDSQMASPENLTVVQDFTGAFQRWSEANPDTAFIVLRPDRYVAAIADGDEGLRRITCRLAKILR